MAILVNGSLGSSHTWVKIHLATLSETIHLTARCAEVSYLVGNLKVALVEDNIVLGTIGSTTTAMLGRVFNAGEATFMQELTCCLIAT